MADSAVHQGEPAAPPGRGISPLRSTVTMVVIGLVITGSVSWTALILNRHNEHQLLEVQTRQATAVLSATILSIQNPVKTELEVQLATGGSIQQLDQFATESVGPSKLFISATLWKSAGGQWQPVATVGAQPLLAPSSPQAHALVAQAITSPTFVVRSILVGGVQRIAYAIADRSRPTFAISAERPIPANRQVAVESGSAFSDLDYATYIGDTTTPEALATTDLPPSELPITGDVVRTTIPFGTSTLTLVASPRSALGGALGRILPWVFLVGGVILTGVLALATNLVVVRRRRAEDDATTIAGLYRQLDGLYGEQRSISETLQRALLPVRDPSIPNLEIASRYVAGAAGVEIGGDWYSLIEIDHRRFAFAVGDVSGKGVASAAVMARLRFTIGAYLLEGHAPEVVLARCSEQLDVTRDGHLATVLVGVGDLDTGTVTVANAGHLNPLVVAGGSATVATTAVGLPLGVAPSTYATTTIQLGDGDALVAFTDGLVERRGETIDSGVDRVVQAAPPSGSSVDDLLDALTGTVGDSGPADDIAILVIRWWDPESPLRSATITASTGGLA